MFQKLLIALLFSIVISNIEAYQLDEDQTHMDNINEKNELKDPYFIQRLRALLAAAEAVNTEDGNKDFSSNDHAINTRLAMNRRPGLLRLKKSD